MGSSPSHIRVVLAPNPSPMTLDGTRTYIIDALPPLVIDPGPGLSDHVEAVVSELGERSAPAIFVTHSHSDHSGAAAELAERTGGRIHMSAAGLETARLPPHLSRPTAAGDRLPVGAGDAEVLATPGHSPDHLSLHWRDPGSRARGIVFVGDLLMGEGDTTLVAAPEGNLADYLASLDRIAALDAATIYPAHGPPLTDPAEAIGRYRRHRAARVAQVRAALLERPDASPRDLVAAIYGTALHPALAEAAAGSIAAVIEYLRSPAAPPAARARTDTR